MSDRILGALLKSKKWLRRMLALIGVLVLLPVAGALYQVEASRLDTLAFPAPGKRIDVGGYRLHIYCTGPQLRGSPTVVFEGGLGASSIMWMLVQQGVAPHTRACSYDRAGYGWSDPGPQPRTAQQIVGELHHLLELAAEQPPYILVGHSLGGILIRLYASLYPEQVAGLVLVDARHEDFFKRMPPAFLQTDEANFQRARILGLITPFGFTRLAGNFGFLDSSERYLALLPEQVEAQAKAIMFYNPQHWRTSVAEREVIQESFDEVRIAPLQRKLRLVVLIASNGVEAWQPRDRAIDATTRAAWMDLQQELAKLTENSEAVIVNQSGHYIQLDRPDAVVDTILKLCCTAAWL